VLRPAFLKACRKGSTGFGRGHRRWRSRRHHRRPLKRKSGIHNSVIVLGRRQGDRERFKVDLPNYGEFDEKRVFDRLGRMPGR
jgi:NAD+ synthase